MDDENAWPFCFHGVIKHDHAFERGVAVFVFDGLSLDGGVRGKNKSQRDE